MRVERLQREYDIRVEYVNFPLHADTPQEGVALLELFGGEAARPRLRESQQRLKALAAAEGLPISDREMTYNSRSAQELGAWATRQGKGKEFHDAVYRAYFVDGRNIAERDVLLALAASAGLDPKEAAGVLDHRTFKSVVDQEWAASRTAGVTAVPTFEAGGRKVVGAQPYGELVRLLQQAGAKKRAG